GHEDELARIGEELDETPIVTLTGVGGVGKTRMAFEVASRFGSHYADGAWVAELAGVRDADAVTDAVLDVFGIQARRGLSPSEALHEFLRNKELLLVLDNCEHLLRPVSALVAEVVRECAGVRILATSREGLGVAGEHIV